ncbi:MAG: hypothetical protein AAGA44_06280 [Pseudomonadota bacterium]
MKFIKMLAVLLLLPATVAADINIDGVEVSDLKNWYIHANFDYMRNTSSGKKIYAWMEKEVFDELKDEAGIDIDKDVDQMLATSDGDNGVIFLVNGTVRQEHKDQIMALAATQNLDPKPRKAGRHEYFWMEGDDSEEPFEDGAYFSFSVKDKLLVTSSEEAMKELLGNNGRVGLRKERTMFLFSAENGAVGGDADADWDSNIMQNTEEASLSIADDGGKVRIEASLVATEPEMADSLASIVRGLISLQAFNDDIDPEVSQFLKSTKVDVKDRTLSISLSLDADTVVDNLDN